MNNFPDKNSPIRDVLDMKCLAVLRFIGGSRSLVHFPIAEALAYRCAIINYYNILVFTVKTYGEKLDRTFTH